MGGLFSRAKLGQRPVQKLSGRGVIGFGVGLVLLATGGRPAAGALVRYDLTIAREPVRIAGKTVVGITVNHEIPGPTLYFREGDTARIRVHNSMSVPTSVHWHGLLVPPGMDGVPLVSFPPIQPGSTFTYQFPIRQSGTYWYHSHSDLQEQAGLYGAIVILPRRESKGRKLPEHVVVLSDWTHENPHAVNRLLKRGSEWYALEKGSAQSLLGALKIGMTGAYFKREVLRMPPMDIADVAYDCFLANGKPQASFPAVPGRRCRIRIVNGSATTYFYLEFAGGPMTIVAADGMPVRPVREKRFLIAVAETYDVLIQAPAAPGAYELRATAQDGSGHASIWLGTGERHPAPDIPRPNLYQTMGRMSLKRIFALTPAGSIGMTDRDVRAGKFDRPGMAGKAPGAGGMPGMTGGGPASGGKLRLPGMAAEHAPCRSDSPRIPAKGSGEKPQIESPCSGKRFAWNFGWLASDAASSGRLAMDGKGPERPWAPYAALRALKPTAFPPERPVRIIRITLDGDMERYVWTLNNKTLSESDMIRIKKGETVRFILINRTMMHHPMHLHGHFFRVLNGQGKFSPWKHTVDVAPMSTTVIEFAADEFGDWFFHCHLLYHMKAGMARVVHYDGYSVSPRLQALRSGLKSDPWIGMGGADVLSNMTEGEVSLSNTRNILAAEWEVGWGDVDSIQSESLLSYNRYFNRFFTILVGADTFATNGSIEKTRGVLGFHYLLPLNLLSTTWCDTRGGARFRLAKNLQLTPRLSLTGDIQYDTHDRWEGAGGVSYRVSRDFLLRVQWHSEYGWGAGIRWEF